MTDDQRIPAEAAQAAPSAPATGGTGRAGRSEPAASGQAPAVNGDIQDMVDPFDYAETIVRDLALHVGTRLRDFRADLAAMHSAVVQLPETMKINALGQSIHDLRERMAHLSGLVNQLSRPSEETAALNRTMGELTQRLAGVEGWIAAARQVSAQGGDLPAMPIPKGGFVGVDQFDRVLDQVHESIMRVVGAVRDLQLDLRDLRTDVKLARPALPPPTPAAPPTAAPAPSAGPVAPPAPSWPAKARAELDSLTQRLDLLEQRPVPAALPAAAPQAGGPAPLRDLAALLFGAWDRLAMPAGPEALRRAVEEVLGHVEARLPHLLRLPQVNGGSGLVAVADGPARSAPATVLLAVEDLDGRGWRMEPGGAELVPVADGPVRVPVWRTLLGACALTQRTRPGTLVLPILIYGHGQLNAVPRRDSVLAFGQSIGAGEAAARLLCVGADDLPLPELLRPADVGLAMASALQG